MNSNEDINNQTNKLGKAGISNQNAMLNMYPKSEDNGEIDLNSYRNVKFIPTIAQDDMSTSNTNNNGTNRGNNNSISNNQNSSTNPSSNTNTSNNFNTTIDMSNVFMMTRLQIKEIQSMLKRGGFGPNLAVDGIIGPETRRAVRNFQRANGLVVDGIIGPQTYMVMNNYLNGYMRYKIRKGDSFYSIGKKYGINYKLIEAANYTLNPTNLIVGTDIILPINIGIVPTDMEYTYEMMLRNLRSFKVLYPFIDLERSGESSLGKGIYYFKVGNGENKVYINAATHALEWITSPLVMKYSENYLKDVVKGEKTATDNFTYTTLTVMPMVNPDGVSLVLEGLSETNPNYQNLIVWNNNSRDFSKTWQANNNGVDINHNYNAGFDEYKSLAAQNGITGPGPTRYPGEYAESEPETRAVVNAVNLNNYDMAISYHTQGEIIYWKYQNIEIAGAKLRAEELARVSGYSLAQESGLSSYSGFKDWFILVKNNPGYTVEAGLGKNPLPISQFDRIYEANYKLITRALGRF